MADSNSLLATLAQSSAAVVAIVGGFLVSRLVVLSSEREGLRRQSIHAQDRLRHVANAYTEAHEYRLANSKDAFFGWVIKDVVTSQELDKGVLISENIPRGSTESEMAPYLEEIIAAVSDAKARVGEYLQDDDDETLELDDLCERGLVVTDAEHELYQHVVDHVAEQLPEKPVGPFGVKMPVLRLSSVPNSVSAAAELRRLDDSIREEQDLHGQKAVLEAEVSRLEEEILRIGKPAGVTPAVLILALYSLLGIVAPVIVMGFAPRSLAWWIEWLLIASFIVGLCAVLIYIYWYATTLNDPVDALPKSKGSRRFRRQKSAVTPDAPALTAETADVL